MPQKHPFVPQKRPTYAERSPPIWSACESTSPIPRAAHGTNRQGNLGAVHREGRTTRVREGSKLQSHGWEGVCWRQGKELPLHGKASANVRDRLARDGKGSRWPRRLCDAQDGPVL